MAIKKLFFLLIMTFSLCQLQGMQSLAKRASSAVGNKLIEMPFCQAAEIIHGMSLDIAQLIHEVLLQKYRIILWKYARSRKIEASCDKIYSLAISGNGNYALIGCTKGFTVFLDLKQTGKEVLLHKDTSPISCYIDSTSLTHDGGLGLIVRFDGAILWHLANGQITKKPLQRAHRRTLSEWDNSGAMSQDGSFAVTGLGDGNVAYWDLHKEPLTPEILLPKAHDVNVLHIALSSNGLFCLSACDKRIVLWQLGKEASLLIAVKTYGLAVKNIAINANGALGVACCGDGSLYAISSESIKKYNFGMNYFNSIALSEDGNFIVAVLGHSSLTVADAKQHPLTFNLIAASTEESPIAAMALSKNNTAIITGALNGSVKVWDLNALKELSLLQLLTLIRHELGTVSKTDCRPVLTILPEWQSLVI